LEANPWRKPVMRPLAGTAGDHEMRPAYLPPVPLLFRPADEEKRAGKNMEPEKNGKVRDLI
jgi:hypothetical protein